MDAIVSEDGVMGGQPRIEGRRISVLQVIEWVHEEGMAPETVATEFDLDMYEPAIPR
jgi:uncharacterized protein (DUF433 family)